MSEPSLTPNNPDTWYVPGKITYNLSDLFTFDPGTDSTVTWVGVEFDTLNEDGLNQGVTFSGTPLINFTPDPYYEYVLYGSPINAGAGSFFGGTVTFNSGFDLSYDFGYASANPGSGFQGFTPVFFDELIASMLFTIGVDTVDFNNLTSDQQEAIALGADIYHGLGGNDIVTLPDKANYAALGWTDTSASTFYTGSKPGDIYTVSGGDGDYYISAGAGKDDITIDGSGHSIITPGLGTLNASIAGGGTLSIAGTFLGSETAFSGGTASGTTLATSAALYVSAGGAAVGTHVNSGGHEFVELGGTDSGAIVNAGGELTVSAGGRTVSASLVGTAPSGGGALEIVDGGVASATTLSASG
jgi:autotransporter passenger strand-loop-strand repeat protein